MERTLQPNRAGLGWLIQAVSGLLLVLLLGLHMIANHFFVEGGLQTYTDVVAYLGNPLITILELSFLIVVTTHALLGVRSIIFDTGISRGAVGRVNTGLAVLGVLIVAYGLLLTFLIVSRG